MSQRPDDRRPDVEAIVASIREGMERADASVPGAVREGERREEDLAGNLEAANRACQVGGVPPGPSGIVQRVAYRLIRPLIREINLFHSRTTMTLNALARILAGNDPAAAGELIDLQRRRLSLQERMSGRLAEYDALRIDERLRAIEARLAELDRGKDPR